MQGGLPGAETGQRAEGVGGDGETTLWREGERERGRERGKGGTEGGRKSWEEGGREGGKEGEGREGERGGEGEMERGRESCEEGGRGRKGGSERGKREEMREERSAVISSKLDLVSSPLPKPLGTTNSIISKLIAHY